MPECMRNAIATEGTSIADVTEALKGLLEGLLLLTVDDPDDYCKELIRRFIGLCITSVDQRVTGTATAVGAEILVGIVECPMSVDAPGVDVMIDTFGDISMWIFETAAEVINSNSALSALVPPSVGFILVFNHQVVKRIGMTCDTRTGRNPFNFVSLN